MFFNRFWKHWGKTERLIFWCCALPVIGALFFLCVSWANYPAPTIPLREYQQIQTSETPTHQFSVGTISIDVPAESLVILENFLGSPVQVQPIAYYLLLMAIVILFVVSAAIISMLERFWFLIGSGLLILFMASLRLDTLAIFGAIGKIPFIAASLLVLVPVYYFQSFKKEEPFALRVAFFLILTAILGVAILFFSRTAHPFMHLAANGLIAAMVLTFIFILLVAHEIIAFFIWLISQGAGQSKAIRHFLLLSSIYVINLFLSYATKMGFIHWNLWTVNGLLLFMISATLGFWGFRQRKEMYESFFETEAIGTIFYLSLCLLSVCTITFFNLTASDLMYDDIQDIVLYSHIGFGMIFIFYAIINFGPLMMKNLPVFKILYKPESMPYFTFRLMGIIAAFTALLFGSNWKRYVNEATATYYSCYADLYLYEGDPTAAQAYYQRSLRFRNQNHHAHYGMANLASAQLDATLEREEYNVIRNITPSVEGYLNLSHDYSINGDVLQSALVLDEAVKKFPRDGILLNAQGLSMMQLRQVDSAFYFFRKAAQTKAASVMGQTNFMAACSIFKTHAAADSILSSQDFKSAGSLINGLALANAQRKKINEAPEKKNDTLLTIYQTAWLSNYFINQKEKADTSLLSYAERLAAKPSNEDFAEWILVSSSHARYARGEVKKACATVRNLAYATGEGKYFQLLGLWMLELRNPAVAANYLKIAFDKNQPNALLHLAIANTEADSTAQALRNWDSLQHSKKHSYKQFAATMAKVLRSQMFDPNFSDEEKYYFCRYKTPLMDSAKFFQQVNSMGDRNLQALSYLDRAQKWFDLDEGGLAAAYLRKAQEQGVEGLTPAILSLQLMLAADRQDINFIQTLLNDSLPISANQQIYLKALLNEREGNTAAAKEKYAYLAQADVQFEDALVASSRFFAADTSDRLKPYSILVDGLLLKPYSVKLLKLYVLEAALLGFEAEAQQALQKLEAVLPKHLFKKFVSEHPDFFSEE